MGQSGPIISIMNIWVTLCWQFRPLGCGRLLWETLCLLLEAVSLPWVQGRFYVPIPLPIIRKWRDPQILELLSSNRRRINIGLFIFTPLDFFFFFFWVNTPLDLGHIIDLNVPKPDSTIWKSILLRKKERKKKILGPTHLFFFFFIPRRKGRSSDRLLHIRAVPKMCYPIMGLTLRWSDLSIVNLIHF